MSVVRVSQKVEINNHIFLDIGLAKVGHGVGTHVFKVLEVEEAV